MLKSLEVLGFKSFADRIRFDFASGITGVVGPNGSGKSNVVDAIKWVLGDQSAKSLRGKEMTDVIFNGATGRKAAEFAEATLTFDNSSGFLPVDSQEVQIGRRLWRSGEGEYLLNRGPARLKDIRELLMGTGAGSAAYNIIEQGRVDRILQANATSRRAIFEEAAGISRYKARKTEALRKLERVDQNLLRLTDLVDEVEAQLNSLRSQAAKAAKYREVSEELKHLWLGLAADDHRYQTRRLRMVEEEIAQLRSGADQLDRRSASLETERADLEERLAEIDERAREVADRCTANREAIARHEAAVRHQNAQLQDLEEEIERLLHQRRLMARRVAEVAGEFDRVRQQADAFRAFLSDEREKLAERDEETRLRARQAEEDRQRIQRHREDLLQRMREVSAAERQVAECHSQAEALREDRNSLQQRRAEIEQRIASARDDVRRRQFEIRRIEPEVVAAEQTCGHLRSRRAELEEEARHVEGGLADRREQRSDRLARKTVLEDLEQRQAGMSIGLREILARAQTSDYPPWNRILGRVADLLEIDLEDAPLVDVALGHRAGYLVLEQLGPLIEYLQSETCHIAGRVGFVGSVDGEPTTVDSAESPPRPPDGDVPDLSEHPGVRHRADRLVGSPPDCPRLAEQLLSDTWIVETLSEAVALAAGPGRGCRFVTLQGELLDGDGTLAVGSVSPDRSLVWRTSELRRLKTDLRELDRAIAGSRQRLDELHEAMRELDRDAETAETELQQRLDEQSARQAALRSAEETLQRLLQEDEALRREAERIAGRERDSAAALQQARTALATAEADLQTIQADLEGAERESARREQELQSVREAQSAAQLELAKQEERLENLQQAVDRLEEEHRQRLEQRDDVERRWDAARARRRKATLQILNTGSRLAEHFLTDEHLAARTAELTGEKTRLRDRRSRLLDEEAQLRRRQQELRDREHEKDIAARDLRTHLTSLAARIEEEYQLDLGDVVASGASAIRETQNPPAPSPETRSAAPEQLGEPDGGPAAPSPGDEPDEEDVPEPDVSQFPAVRDELEGRVDRLRRKLKMMGQVDTDSLQNLDELESRYEHLHAQLQDLTEAKRALEEIVRRINTRSKQLFTETFESIRGHFRDLFRKAFGGGDGDILLEDPDDVLECGIDILARPPGKELKSISLMSGGEKTLTAFVLLLALFKSRPSPYCILDEVDAALDESNVGRLLAMLEEFRETTQFVMVTHKKPTMAIADVLYGVTMEQSGVSKRLSIRFEDVREDGRFVSRSGGTSSRDAA